MAIQDEFVLLGRKGLNIVYLSDFFARVGHWCGVPRAVHRLHPRAPGTLPQGTGGGAHSLLLGTQPPADTWHHRAHYRANR